jgi:hypothetical protein
MVDKDWLNTTLGSHINIEPLVVPMYMQLMDGSRGSEITGQILLDFVIGEHTFQEQFLVTSLNPRFPIALGLSFLTKHNPDVDWRTRTLVSLRETPVATDPIKSKAPTPGQISLDTLATHLVHARTAHFAPDLISKLGGGGGVHLQFLNQTRLKKRPYLWTSRISKTSSIWITTLRHLRTRTESRCG